MSNDGLHDADEKVRLDVDLHVYKVILLWFRGGRVRRSNCSLSIMRDKQGKGSVKQQMMISPRRPLSSYVQPGITSPVLHGSL